jgi:hypothetical protein
MIDTEMDVGTLLYKQYNHLVTDICYTRIEMNVGSRSSRGNKVEIKIDDYEYLWFQYRGGRSSSDAL